MSTPRTFRAGDVVKHLPTGETWTLATDDDYGKVYPCGWPCCMANVSDCQLIRAATDAERDDTLLRVSRIEGPDPRKGVAMYQLSKAIIT